MAEEKHGYEMLEHTGDICIKAVSATLPGLFAESAHGMMAYLYGAALVRDGCSDGREVVEVSAADLCGLLFEWLAELHYRAEVRHRAYVAFDFDILTPQVLRAAAFWRTAVAEDEIKAVTYHDLRVSNTAGRWEASVVYDI